MADVQKHADGNSCWTAIGGNVYDLTAWINQHPGGADAILSLCGVDGTQAFNAQHGGQARPEQELATLKIGALIQ
jgi:cytochrome b involved in lipid metabolism